MTKIHLHLNLVAHDQYIELPGDVPVNAFSGGALNGLNGFAIDPRSTDDTKRFCNKLWTKVFYQYHFHA